LLHLVGSSILLFLLVFWQGKPYSICKIHQVLAKLFKIIMCYLILVTQDNVVVIVTRMRALWPRTSGSISERWKEDIFLLQSARIDSRTSPLSYSVLTRVPCPLSKQTAVWIWPLIFTHSQFWESVGLLSHSLIRLHGVPTDNCTLPPALPLVASRNLATANTNVLTYYNNVYWLQVGRHPVAVVI